MIGGGAPSGGALVTKIENLKAATSLLGGLTDPSEPLLDGAELCDEAGGDIDRRSGGGMVCGRAAREMPTLGKELVRARRAHGDAMRQIADGASANAECARSLRRRAEDRQAQTVISSLDSFLQYLETVDDRLARSERCFRGVAERARGIASTCNGHGAFRRAAGKALLFGGCVVVAIAALALATTRRTVDVAAASAGGIAAAIGVRAAAGAKTHSRYASRFDGLAEKMDLHAAGLRSQRTRFQRLRRAVNELVVMFRIQVVVGGVNGAVWVELSEWAVECEAAMAQILKESAVIDGIEFDDQDGDEQQQQQQQQQQREEGGIEQRRYEGKKATERTVETK